jgi:histidinol-phosphate aminotransferase
MDVTPRIHGGADARGAARWDFSTCGNAAGPCPGALAAVRAADPTRYPDPATTAVRHALAALHGVEAWRVLPAASASEFIQRVTAVTGRLWPGAVSVPTHAYGDYAAAAMAWGRPPSSRGEAATLRWCADPSSPLGQDAMPPAGCGARPTVLDAVYAPLRLTGRTAWNADALDAVFVLHSPNKALGLTGLRGAYAIAPRAAAYDVQALCRALEATAPSWPLSAQSNALLLSWATPQVQDWVARSRIALAQWKADLQGRLTARGFELQDSVTPYFVVRPPRPLDLSRLRAHDVGVRDTGSFGLPGCWRVSAQPPEAQDALVQALETVEGCGS